MKKLSIINQGKRNGGNRKFQIYINLFVIFGFILFIVWVLFFYPKTFINIKIILGLLFFPSLLITFFLGENILRACGYEFPIKANRKYNILVSIAVYFLVTVVAGNIVVSSLLIGNYIFATKEVSFVKLTPLNVSKSYSRKTGKIYSHFEVEFQGVEKRINTGNRQPVEIENKIILLKLSRGLFGYSIMRGFKIQDF